MHRVLARVGELKVVVRASHTEHYAVKSVMVLEASDDTKTKAATVHVLGTFDIANRPSDAKMKRHDGLLTVEGAVKRIALKLRERVLQQQVGLERARAEAPPRA